MIRVQDALGRKILIKVPVLSAAAYPFDIIPCSGMDGIDVDWVVADLKAKLIQLTSGHLSGDEVKENVVR